MFFPSFKNLHTRFHRDESGITGLETAIVLIAFVVVAAVFAFTVLTTGLFTSEKAKETALAGVATTSSSLTIKGSIIAEAGDPGPVPSNSPTQVNWIRVKVAVATGVEQVLFDPPQTLITYMDEGNVHSINAFQATANGTEYLITDDVTRDACANAAGPVWCLARDGNDPLLDPGEVDEIYIFLDNLNPALTTNGQFAVELIPQDGAVLKFERRTPLSLSPVMNLD